MKKLLILVAIFTALGLIFVTTMFRTTSPAPNAVIINDAVMTYSQDRDAHALTAMLTIAFEEMDEIRQVRDERAQMFMYIIIAAFFVLAATVLLYCHYSILRPFAKLRDFAKSISEGDLDTPLAMDRHNRFGAFTESFDIMREELARANHSKKELVASLSHDIKTPIASIKAVTELMMLKVSDEKDTDRLRTISAKAEQVNALITNMFHATLEELQVLQVTTTQVASTEILGLLQSADYEKRASIGAIPTCLLLADTLRLQQVFDNIFSNSYKYANTSIGVTAAFVGTHLEICVQDYGAGVAEDELPRLFDKFYRGGNKAKAAGQGLGLHIAKFFMGEMQGDIVCEVNESGFAVKVRVKLA